jgi:hypothetical protein
VVGRRIREAKLSAISESGPIGSDQTPTNLTLRFTEMALAAANSRLCHQEGTAVQTTTVLQFLPVFVAIGAAQFSRPEIPRAWDDQEIATFQVPLGQRDRSPRFMTSEYYKLNVRPIYRTYPMYLSGREPLGYMESLKQKAPEIVFDPSKLQTEMGWIRAGELVFDAAPTVEVLPPERLKAAEAQDQMVLQWGIPSLIHCSAMPLLLQKRTTARSGSGRFVTMKPTREVFDGKSVRGES